MILGVLLFDNVVTVGARSQHDSTFWFGIVVSAITGLGGLLLAWFTLVQNAKLKQREIAANERLKQLELDTQERLKKYELDVQDRLKKYEVQFDEKRKSFVQVFAALGKTVSLVLNRYIPPEQQRATEQSVFLSEEELELLEQLSRAFGEEAAAFYGLIPFLPESDHAWVEETATSFEGLVRTMWGDRDRTTREQHHREYEGKLKILRPELYRRLFGQGVSESNVRDIPANSEDKS